MSILYYFGRVKEPGFPRRHWTDESLGTVPERAVSQHATADPFDAFSLRIPELAPLPALAGNIIFRYGAVMLVPSPLSRKKSISVAGNCQLIVAHTAIHWKRQPLPTPRWRMFFMLRVLQSKSVRHVLLPDS